ILLRIKRALIAANHHLELCKVGPAKPTRCVSFVRDLVQHRITHDQRPGRLATCRLLPGIEGKPILIDLEGLSLVAPAACGSLLLFGSRRLHLKLLEKHFGSSPRIARRRVTVVPWLTSRSI